MVYRLVVEAYDDCEYSRSNAPRSPGAEHQPEIRFFTVQRRTPSRGSTAMVHALALSSKQCPEFCASSPTMLAPGSFLQLECEYRHCDHPCLETKSGR